MAVYNMSRLVMMDGLGMKPLATSTQSGLAALSSYAKQPVMTCHYRQLMTDLESLPAFVIQRKGP